MDRNLLSFDGHLWPSEMCQRSYDGNAARIDECTVMVEKVNVGADAPTFLTRYDAEGFSVDGM